MSLKAFHIFFILASALMCLGIGAWRAAAFAEAGKKPGEIQVLAVDAQAATLQAIRDGWITGTLNQLFFDAVIDGEPWGKGTVTRVIEAINGAEQPKFVDAGVELITKDNLPE